MVIEWLRFVVPVADQARYFAADAEIWTAALAAQPGFLGKEVWCRHDAPDQVNLIIRWESRAQWKAVPEGVLRATDAAFRAAMGRDYPVIECVDMDVI
ncbi:MAG: TIGR03792 family protein [Paracoccaceae bacterium]